MELPEISKEKKYSSIMKAAKAIVATVEADAATANMPAVKERLNMLKETIEDAEIRSITSKDEDARIGHKTANSSFFGYKTHMAMSDERIITAATVTSGEKCDGQQLPALIEKTESAGMEIDAIVADTAYSSKSNIELTKSKDIKLAAPLNPLVEKGNRQNTLNFEYNKDADMYVCPAGHMAVRKAREFRTNDKAHKNDRFRYFFDIDKSKSRQATSRRKLLDQLTIEQMPASSRRYPWVCFTPEREAGKDILQVSNLNYTQDGVQLLKDVSFIVTKGQKIALVGSNEQAQTALFRILAEEIKPDSGSFKWGVTTSQSYFPKDNNEFFEGHEENMLDWIAPYSRTDTLESTLRGFLGRMLFSGDDVYKPVRVLSGGEKVRLMLARMMLFGSNVLVIDQPTNHLDLESITAVNNGVRDFKGTVLFASHDHEFVQTIATRIIEIREKGVLDKECTYDEFLEFRETYKG